MFVNALVIKIKYTLFNKFQLSQKVQPAQQHIYYLSEP